MKKKQIKHLKLNKQSISNVTTNAVKGGTVPTLGVICTITIQVTINQCTRWDGCDLPTIGHDDGSICLSQNADWCNGR
ncbi:hypothetical protein [Kordia zhangzhouensis]|uniref:hypothetical protein n=1 Tax=Kordia zhangzhouensis TaxID=1620405 RepID=UPI0006290FBD|nr:hypothetical protein [Kordia zhangzhouensis]